jgi:hypothetical protein
MNNKEFKEKIIESYNNVADMLNNQEDLGYDYDMTDKLNRLYEILTEIVLELK